jgi:hypothetical protein
VWLIAKLWNQVSSWTILWFRILGIFSVENIKRLCVFMFQTWDNSQLLRRVLWISAEQTIVLSLKHKKTQSLYIFNRVRVLHLDKLKEGTWLHSFGLDWWMIINEYVLNISSLCGSCHIQSVEIGVEYWIFRQILYFCFLLIFIWKKWVKFWGTFKQLIKL